MKKALESLLLALVLLSIQSCGGSKSNQELVIGHWNTVKVMEDGKESDINDVVKGFIFKEDSTVTVITEDDQEQPMGNFEFNGDTLIMNGGMAKAYIESLNDKEMTMIPIDRDVKNMEIHLSKQE